MLLFRCHDRSHRITIEKRKRASLHGNEYHWGIPKISLVNGQFSLMVPRDRVKGSIGKHRTSRLKKAPPFILIGRVIDEIPRMHDEKAFRFLRIRSATDAWWVDWFQKAFAPWCPHIR